MKRFIWLAALVLFMVCLMEGAMFSEARADRAVAFFNMLHHTKGQFHGKPFALLPWQDRIIRDVYGTLKPDGTRQYKFAYIEIPKKNGKSELAAAAALYHLFADGEINGEIYGCAADREQAALVFDVAVDMVDQAPALKKRAKVLESTHKIIDKVTGSVYKAESAEAYTKHGLNLSCCIFDELHAQPNRTLWDVMTFGAGDARRQPIWWVITTAGDDPDRVSVGWEQHEYAAMILAGDIVDPTWYPVIYGYEAPEKEDPGAIYDEDLWRAVNPSLGVTIQVDSIREAAQKAKVKPAEERLFRWLRLNQWITTKLTTWLPLSLFDQTVGKWDRTDNLGKLCFLGMDLSSTTDLTALALIFPPQGGQLDWRVEWRCWIPEDNMKERIEKDHVPYDQWAAGGWITATPGNVVDYTKVEETILEIKKFYQLHELPHDPAFATMLVQRLMAAGIECVGVPQTFVQLTNPLGEIERLLKENKMTHENNPVARWCFGNTSIATNGQGLKKYVKEHKGKSVIRTKRIDLTAAWVTGMARAQHYSGPVDLSAAILSGDWGM